MEQARTLTTQSTRSLNCLLVYPEFTSQSFWNYRETCELVGASYPAAPLGLCTVAALLPPSWNVRLIDCNAGKLEDEDLVWADLVLSGGMISQQGEHLKLIERVKKFNIPHIVGGPDATSSPHLYDSATYLVLGEAEVSLPRFIEAFEKGEARHCYAAGDEKADVTTSPVPRFDLLDFSNYLHVGVQFARGCPFNCEFCDIIELFGRTPRLKDAHQILTELDTLYALGYRGHVDFVDDNFIGNRNVVKKLLPQVIEWQKKHNHPFEFSTEATINLADDKELMGLMQEAGFFIIFVGIESPDEKTLKATQKGQNTKRSIPESIRRIYDYGILVNAGYIVGLDGEEGSVSQSVLNCIKETAIPVNMVGLIFALPNTQLTRRLKREGRLLENYDVAPDNAGDQCVGGLNFVTHRTRQEILKDYKVILEQAYSPKSYFERVQDVTRNLNCSKKKLHLPLRHRLKDLGGFFKIILKMGVLSNYKSHFWKTLWLCVTGNPKSIRYTVGMIALYLHFHSFKEVVLGGVKQRLSEPEPLLATLKAGLTPT